MMPLYKEMTADQRKAAFDDAAEAVEIHINFFAIRPVRGRGNRHDHAAINHFDKMQDRMRLIRNVARKMGDDWALTT